jgi:hypothetical protein
VIVHAVGRHALINHDGRLDRLPRKPIRIRGPALRRKLVAGDVSPPCHDLGGVVRRLSPDERGPSGSRETLPLPAERKSGAAGACSVVANDQPEAEVAGSGSALSQGRHAEPPAGPRCASAPSVQAATSGTSAGCWPTARSGVRQQARPGTWIRARAELVRHEVGTTAFVLAPARARLSQRRQGDRRSDAVLAVSGTDSGACRNAHCIGTLRSDTLQAAPLPTAIEARRDSG